MTSKVYFLLIPFMLATACSSSDSTNKVTENQEDSIVSVSNEPEGFRVNSPCDLITEAAVQEIVGFSAEHKVQVKAKVLTYPACVITWNDVIIEVKTFELGEIVEKELPAEVVIKMIRNSNESTYYRAITTYFDAQTVENVGEMATWGDHLSQLTFLADDHIFHVCVKVSTEPEVNKQVASQIGRVMSETLAGI